MIGAAIRKMIRPGTGRGDGVVAGPVVAGADQGVGAELVDLGLDGRQQVVVLAVHDAGDPVGEETQRHADGQGDQGDQADVGAEHARTGDDARVRRDGTWMASMMPAMGRPNLTGCTLAILAKA